MKERHKRIPSLVFHYTKSKSRQNESVMTEIKMATILGEREDNNEPFPGMGDIGILYV